MKELEFPTAKLISHEIKKSILLLDNVTKDSINIGNVLTHWSVKDSYGTIQNYSKKLGESGINTILIKQKRASFSKPDTSEINVQKMQLIYSIGFVFDKAGSYVDRDGNIITENGRHIAAFLDMIEDVRQQVMDTRIDGCSEFYMLEERAVSGFISETGDEDVDFWRYELDMAIDHPLFIKKTREIDGGLLKTAKLSSDYGKTVVEQMADYLVAGDATITITRADGSIITVIAEQKNSVVSLPENNIAVLNAVSKNELIPFVETRFEYNDTSAYNITNGSFTLNADTNRHELTVTQLVRSIRDLEITGVESDQVRVEHNKIVWIGDPADKPANGSVNATFTATGFLSYPLEDGSVITISEGETKKIPVGYTYFDDNKEYSPGNTRLRVVQERLYYIDLSIDRLTLTFPHEKDRYGKPQRMDLTLNKEKDDNHTILLPSVEAGNVDGSNSENLSLYLKPFIKCVNDGSGAQTLLTVPPVVMLEDEVKDVPFDVGPFTNSNDIKKKTV